MQRKPFAHQHLALPALLGALATFAAPAQAIEATVNTNSVIEGGGTRVVLNETPNRLQLHNSFLAALNAANAQIEPIGRGVSTLTKNPRNKYIFASFELPIASLTVDLDPDTRRIEALGFASRGGLRLTTNDDGLTNSGGSLSITNLNVNLRDRRIYADVEGDNGVGFKEQLAVWNIGAMTPLGEIATTECNVRYAGCRTDVAVNTTLSELWIETEAFQVFSQALGLQEDGLSALRKVTSYGTFTTNVPEASTVTQMGLGLAGLGLLAARRRRSVQWRCRDGRTSPPSRTVKSRHA